MTGAELKTLCEESGLKPETIQARMVFTRSRYYKLLKKKDVSVEELQLVAKAIGRKPGDLIENSLEEVKPLLPLVEELKRFSLGSRDHVRDMLRAAALLEENLLNANNQRAESQDNSRIKPTVAYTPRSVNNEAVNEEPNAVVLAAMQGSITNSNVSEDSEDASSPRAGKRETTYRQGRSTEKKAKG